MHEYLSAEPQVNLVKIYERDMKSVVSMYQYSVTPPFQAQDEHTEYTRYTSHRRIDAGLRGFVIGQRRQR